ncbi:hypothetical protein [Candidatus Uabimicrobium sp. HlEnr_7]|uniref:hypothetical protein n=1 Tax=Candidatus Uabimicrobium helgolandensis TaxID=3095367 RepID=UPI003556CADA
MRNEGTPFITERICTINAKRRVHFLACLSLKRLVSEMSYVFQIAKEIGIKTSYKNLQIDTYEVEDVTNGPWEVS